MKSTPKQTRFRFYRLIRLETSADSCHPVTQVDLSKLLLISFLIDPSRPFLFRSRVHGDGATVLEMAMRLPRRMRVIHFYPTVTVCTYAVKGTR